MNSAALSAVSQEPPSTREPDLAAPALIVADVGGTFARLAWADGDLGALSVFRSYRCNEHASLGAILADFARARPQSAVRAVVAIAGILQGDTLVNANLPWPVSRHATEREAGLRELQLINDFEAVALAIPHVRDDALVPLLGGPVHRFAWPALVLGAGTGLGAALRFADGERPVLPIESGQASLAAGTALELDVLRVLLQRTAHVENERILSGTGLLTLYRVLAELRAVAPRLTCTEDLVAAARRGEDALAVETVQVFCGWLGSFAGDLAIALGARTVYLAGGIATHIAGWLGDGRFAARFLDKGVMRPLLETVPVWRVEHGALGLVGATAWQRPCPAQGEGQATRHPHGAG